MVIESEFYTGIFTYLAESFLVPKVTAEKCRNLKKVLIFMLFWDQFYIKKIVDNVSTAV